MTLNLGAANRTVSAIAVVDLANELISNQYIDDHYLSNMGAHFLALYDAWKTNRPIQEYRLPETLLINLWQQASSRGEDTDIGLKIGSNVNLQSKGVLANWLSHCSTLAEAFSTFSQNISLLNPSEHWYSSVESNQIKLTVQFSSPQYPSIAIDRSMAAILSWSRSLSNEKISPSAVSLKRPKPNSYSTYNCIFGNTTLFDQAENCLWFSKSIFDQTIKDANPYLKELVAKQAMKLNTELSNAHTLSAISALNRLLTQDLAHYSQISATCEALHVSRSTLYRKLKREGTSFTELVKEARLLKLKNGELRQISHDDLADKLGFQDISSYYRFRKQHY